MFLPFYSPAFSSKITASLRLRLINFPVDFVRLQQFFMRSKSIDPAFIHHNDTVCILHTETRWAMISLVVSGTSFLNALRIFASVAVSTALVLSSRIRIFGFLELPWQYRVSASVHRIHCFHPVRCTSHISLGIVQ